jgi:cytochrome P450
LTRLASDYGDVAHFQLANEHVVLLNHPDYIYDVLVRQAGSLVKGRSMQVARRVLGNGLLTSEDPYHRQQRRITQPAFHQQRISAYADVMIHHAVRTSSRWQPESTIDVNREMMGVTLGIIAETLFGATLQDEASAIWAAMTETMEYLNLVRLPFGELLMRLPAPPTRRAARARARMDDSVARMVGARRENRAAAHSDLLETLLSARTEDGAALSDAQVRDEVITIFLTGHETVAVALTWTWYLLAQHPDVEARLHAEVDSVLDSRPPCAARLSELRYTRMVLAESMRLYPPAWAVARRAATDIRVGSYDLPAGTLLLASQFVTHRDARFFPRPERFDPGRWSRDVGDGHGAPGGDHHPRLAYFPFGGGPRACIGEGFAWTEAILVLAVLARGWRLRRISRQPVELHPLVSLRPKHDVQMRLERR